MTDAVENQTVEIEVPAHIIQAIIYQARFARAFADTHGTSKEKCDQIERMFIDALGELNEETHGE